MDGLMKSAAGYHMSLDEIKRFIKASEESGYIFDIVLTGGEPSAWKHLVGGVRLLKESRICRTLTMFTNAMHVERLIDCGAVDYLDKIRVSKYSSNEQNIEKLLSKYADKVSVVARDKFWVTPDQPVPNTLPVACLNPEILLFNDLIFACPHSASIAARAGLGTNISRPLERNFLKGLFLIKFKQQRDICTRCISNAKVRKRVEKIDNVSGRLRARLAVLD